MLRALAAALLLAPLPALSQEPAPEAPAAPALPGELPPLDEGLLGLLEGGGEEEPFALGDTGIELLGYGRLRLEVDENRDLRPPSDLQTGLALTGRLGVRAPFGKHSASVVLGDGRRLGQNAGNLPLPIARDPPLGLVYALHLDVDARDLFVPATLRIGRMPLQVGDGRWVGRADFHPRGRTFDGAVLLHEGSAVTGKAGALWLGPFEAGDPAAPSFLLLLEGRGQGRFYEGSTYGFLHRDGTPARSLEPALSLVTVGARGRVSGFGFAAKVGADGQVPLTDESPLEPVGFGVHLEGAVRYGPELDLFALTGTPFLEVSAEWTGGEAYGGRTFRAPGGSPHPFLGILDLAEPDNVLSGAVTLGLETAEGFSTSLEMRLLALADPRGPLYDVAGNAVLPRDERRKEALAFTEVDARARLPLAPGAFLEGEYGVAFPGPALAPGSSPVQRLLLSAIFAIEPVR